MAAVVFCFVSCTVFCADQATEDWKTLEKIRGEDATFYDDQSKIYDSLKDIFEDQARLYAALLKNPENQVSFALRWLYLQKTNWIKSYGMPQKKYDGFLKKIQGLTAKDARAIGSRVKGTELENAFNYFEKEKITLDNLIRELREDFAEEKCMLLDSENVDEKKQLQLNSLEGKNNEIRAIFAVNMLNEGWDVLNLFDIVRLYDTRDGSWVHGKYKPGNTTLGEAQLIGRGARYFPFQLNEMDDKYKRKFDEDAENELRVIETLHYHSAKNSDYITEIKSALTEMGIIPEKYVQFDLFIKPEFKKTDFWKNGVVFINDRVQNTRTDVFSLGDAKVEGRYSYRLKTGEVKETTILDESGKDKVSKGSDTERKTLKLSDFGKNVIRSTLDKFEFYKFETLKKYFPNVKSVREFITSPEYLGSVDIEVSGPKCKLNELTPFEKIEAALFVVKSISEQARVKTSDFVGTNLFKAKMLKEIFHDKNIKIDIDEVRNRELEDINLADKDWYAQNDFYGTSDERGFIVFIDGFIERLRQKYSDIALLRNEKFFQVFDFDEGKAFEPDFIMLLKRRNHVISIHQIFIEPKGDQFKDKLGRFKDSKEGWKQKFLLEMEGKAETDLKVENKHFKLVGLPFYNERLKKEFEEVLENKILN